MLVTDNGQLIRCPVHDIRIASRRTQGVTLFKVDEDERVVSVARLGDVGEADEAEGDEGEEGEIADAGEADDVGEAGEGGDDE